MRGSGIGSGRKREEELKKSLRGRMRRVGLLKRGVVETVRLLRESWLEWDCADVVTVRG